MKDVILESKPDRIKVLTNDGKRNIIIEHIAVGGDGLKKAVDYILRNK